MAAAASGCGSGATWHSFALSETQTQDDEKKSVVGNGRARSQSFALENRYCTTQLQMKLGDRVRVVVQPLFRQEVMALFKAYGQEYTQRLFFQNPAHLSVLARIDMALASIVPGNVHRESMVKTIEFFWQRVSLPGGYAFYKEYERVFHSVFANPLELQTLSFRCQIRSGQNNVVRKVELLIKLANHLENIFNLGTELVLKKLADKTLHKDHQLLVSYLAFQAIVQVHSLICYLTFKEWDYVYREYRFLQRRNLLSTAQVGRLEKENIVLSEQCAMIQSEGGPKMEQLLERRRAKLHVLGLKLTQLLSEIHQDEIDDVEFQKTKPLMKKFDRLIVGFFASHQLFNVFERVMDPSKFSARDFPDLLRYSLELKLRCIPLPKKRVVTSEAK